METEKKVMWFVIKLADDETICTSNNEKYAQWIVENYPEPCEKRKAEF